MQSLYETRPTPRYGCYAVELHCHLDGCVTPEIVYNAAQRKNITLPTGCKYADDLIPYMSMQQKQFSLQDVLDKFYFYLPIIRDDPIAIKKLCISFAKQQYKNKIYYTEVRYCPHLLSGDNLSVEQVLILILDTLRKASNYYGIIIKSLLSNMRSWKADSRALKILELAIKYGINNGGDVVGIDLAGAEAVSDSRDGWKEIFYKAKYEHNINITIHAGEACGPESIWDALDNLYADRIGHGYACCKDMKLMDRMKTEQIHLECCPTSSIITAAVEHNGDWMEHPITLFKEYGLNYGVNSDDPVVLNCQYLGEVDIIREKCGFSKSDLTMCWIRAAKASFLNKSEKQQLVQEIIKRIQLYYLQSTVDIVSKL